jgi:tetratricopeptide (TPR) repeat protein
MTPCFGLAFGLGSLGLASFGPARFLSRRLAAGAAALAAIALPLVLVGGPAGAQNAAVQAPAATPQPARQQAADSPISNFLAARYAEARRDYANAARFYLAALEREPGNFDLMMRAQRVLVASGQMGAASALAQRVLAVAPANPVANLVLVVNDLAHGNAAAAEPRLQAMPTGAVFRIAAPLLRAWTNVALNRPQQAADALRGIGQVAAFSGLVAYHLALIAEVSGQNEEAERQYRRALEVEGPSVRTVEAAAAFFTRIGKPEEGRAVLDRFRRSDGDSALRPQVTDAKTGAAEALMNLATALRQQENNLLDAILFGQLARALAPADDAATLLVADSFESGERRAEANELYARIPAANPLGWVARLRMAENLDLANDTAAAIATLSTMADERPERIDALTTLARILRQRERYADAAVAFDRAIQRLPRAEPWQWALYYQRGISYERSQQWAKAEADFRRALELQPDQPDVLNYLAYSWIDQGQQAHFEEAERMLTRAVEQRPNSPQIIDSLAWAMYRTGRFAEAVRLLERAIELLPLDPTLLDHLGDAYWRVGRAQEARFQWRRALRNNPDNDLRPQLERKVERGLDPVARGN